MTSRNNYRMPAEVETLATEMAADDALHADAARREAMFLSNPEADLQAAEHGMTSSQWIQDIWMTYGPQRRRPEMAKGCRCADDTPMYACSCGAAYQQEVDEERYGFGY